MRKEKMLEKGFSFHYFEENDPYRIERSPVITGDLKMKKNPSWKFTDELSVTFQLSVSGAGEFGLRHNLPMSSMIQDLTYKMDDE